MRILKLTLFLSSALALIGCKKDEPEVETKTVPAPTDPTTPATTTRGTDPTPATPTGGMQPGEILAIAQAANLADIQGGKMASTKATNPEVKAFAELMIVDHTALNAEATTVAGKLGVTPNENQHSLMMKKDHEQTASHLANLSGAEFDRAYIEHEVKMHQQVLDQLEDQLIPAATNPEMKAVLEKSRDKVAEHLEKAKALQAKLQ